MRDEVMLLVDLEGKPILGDALTVAPDFPPLYAPARGSHPGTKAAI